MPATWVFRSSIRWRSSCLPIRSLYPLPNATPSDGIAANNLQGRHAHYKANNQGDIKIEYDPRASDKITGFYSMSHGV